ncbi:MHO_4530 family protein [Mycoplasma miroungirhinis]|uniref:Uncharacterized protein n=1 Tax=Mycoplasma miroungirhinis TaxID=754516 RepID=A0A6M4JDL7_9MOLU|nr:hypothetical protein [Mycoplasma miroungirhinis]QJR44338.1 hypothetical protein HLA92_02770 [Mycoplasma miroungirhinis]
MTLVILISIFLLIIFVTIIIIIFAYVNKYKNTYGFIPLTIDYKNKRIKLLSYQNISGNLIPFTSNQKFNKGHWLSFQEFSNLFLTNFQSTILDLFQEIKHSKKDISIDLKTNKYNMKLTLISPSNINEENAALLYWQSVQKDTHIQINYVNNYNDINQEKNSFKIFLNLKDINIQKKDFIVKYIVSKLDRKYKYKLFIKYSIIYLCVNIDKHNLLNKYFYKLLKTFETSFLDKLCNGIIFIPNNFKISNLDNNIDEIEYLQYLTKKESQILVLNNSYLTDEKINQFEKNYKKIANLLQKGVIKYQEQPIYEFLNKPSNIKFVYPEIDNNNYESNFVLINTSLKYNFLDKFVNIKIKNKTDVFLFPIIDYEFLYLSEQEIKKYFTQQIDQIKIVVVIDKLNNWNLIYKKALSLKAYGIDVIIGFATINNNVIQLLQKLNSQWVVITNKITSSLDISKDFSYLVGLINYVKDTNIKFIFENLNIVKQGYKIRKNLNNFLYSKETE